MTLVAGMAAPFALLSLVGGGFMVNEWSHGSMADAIGLGHRHMLDYAGIHCAPHGGDGSAAHVAHMHGSPAVAHTTCPGGAAMHGNGTMPAPDAMAGGGMHG